MPKRPLDVENKENEVEQDVIDTNELISAKKAKMIDVPSDHEEEDDDDDDDDDEEEKGPWPISSVLERNDGTIHPTNKQYFVYENTEPTMISKTARFWSRKYLKIVPHVNPDTYDMYIHNDFVFYGELEIIENCLIDIAKGIFLKRKTPMNMTHYITAFRRLEALTIVLQRADNFLGMDDGQRYVQFIRLIGSCYVTILTGLLPKSFVDNSPLTHDDMKKLKKISHQLPNFQEVLRQALILGHTFLMIGFVSSAYTNILQSIYCNWSIIMVNIRIDLNGKPEKKDEDVWEALKHAAGMKKEAFKESFNFLKEFELYSKKNPDLGGNSHDLRKWSKTRRDLYSFDRMDDDPVGHFWLRL